ncbi:MAG: DUF928 domain-containing protein [Calothrix sp. SM1_7_51]|nr:DUF928 domain-containing protein [Calothrix sp. SM1_7_51]
MKRFITLDITLKLLKVTLKIALLTTFGLQYATTIVVAQSQPAKKPTSRLVFTPPKVPTNAGTVSGRRAGLGSRNNCPRVQTQLTALVPIKEDKISSRENISTPVNVGGLTTSERPTFWFYLPYTNNDANVSAEFVLEDKQGKNIYSNPVQLQSKPSIISVTLPSSAPTLEIGQTYRWYFKVRCNQQVGANPPVYVEGYIQRINLNQNLQQQLLAATNPRKKFRSTQLTVFGLIPSLY